MRTLELVTYADAPPEVLFDLSLDVEVHTRSTGAHEEIVGGVRTGHMALGDDVTWRARHFGIPWTMTSKITAYDRPHHFVDEQQRGPFASWWHRHEFHPDGTGTRMVDQVRYASPLGPLGRAVDAAFLERYMRTLLERRNTHLAAEATAGGSAGDQQTSPRR